MEEAFCEFDGPRVLRWIIDRGGDGFAANGNGHLIGGRKGVVVEGIVKDYGLIRTGIETEGLDAWLRSQFAEAVEDAGRALVGPEFKAEEVMSVHMPENLMARVAEGIRSQEAVPA